MKQTKYIFDGKHNTSAEVRMTKDSIYVHLCISGWGVWSLRYELTELDMALALAEYYTRKVDPAKIKREGILTVYPLLQVYSHLNAYSKRRQKQIISRWKEVYYCEETARGLKPLYNTKLMHLNPHR